MNVSNYNHLYYFYVIAKLDGVSAAAKFLRTSQSSLSIQIKNLEAVLELKLFKKVGRKLELTASGREIFQYCRRGFEIFDEMFDHLSKSPNSMGARIIIGVADEIDRPFATEILAKVSRQYTKDKRPLLNLISLPSSKLLQSLKAGEIDILLTTNALIDPSVEIIRDFSIPVGIFVNSEIYKNIQKMSLDKLVKDDQLSFVLPSNMTGLRLEIDNFFAKKKWFPTCTFESNILAAVVRASTDGLGAIIVPKAYVNREIRTERLVQINDKALWKHRLLLLAEKEKLDPVKRKFATDLAEFFLLETLK